jgi:hypothetical protein
VVVALAKGVAIWLLATGASPPPQALNSEAAKATAHRLLPELKLTVCGILFMAWRSKMGEGHADQG